MDQEENVVKHVFEAKDFDPKPIPSQDKPAGGSINYDLDTMDGIRNACERIQRRFLLLRQKFPDHEDNNLAPILLSRDEVARKLMDSRPLLFRMCVNRDCVEKKDQNDKNTVQKLLDLAECANLGIIDHEEGQKAFREALSEIFIRPSQPQRIKKRKS